jgi:hypothetical protein
MIGKVHRIVTALLQERLVWTHGWRETMIAGSACCPRDRRSGCADPAARRRQLRQSPSDRRVVERGRVIRHDVLQRSQ